MIWSTHMVFGLVAVEGFLLTTDHEITPENIPITLGTMAIAMVSATLPDADQKHSKAGKWFPFISLPLSLLHVRHRGLTHSLLFTLIFWFLLSLTSLPSILIAGAVVGYASHWFIDMFNKQPIQLLYPLDKWVKVPFIACPVNSIWEKGVQSILSVVAVWFGFLLLKPILAQYGIIEKIDTLIQFFSRLLSI